MLQAWSGAGTVRMIHANDELRTVLVTIHHSLRCAIELVTFDAVLETLRIVIARRRHGRTPAPRIGVAA